MRSTMMDFPLTVRHIFEHGRTTYADSEVVTNGADGVRRIEFGALADRVDQLAAGLRRLGVEPGDRVATFAWNTQEHQEAYFAIPGMGAVMHTLNIRLSAEQIRYIIGHAEDSVLIADASLASALAPVLAAGGDELKTLRHLIVFGEGDRSELPEHIDYEELLAAEQPGYPWPRSRSTRRRDVLHQRDHRLAEGRRVQPPLDVPALAGRVSARPSGSASTPPAAGRAHVPRQRLGDAVRRLAGRG